MSSEVPPAAAPNKGHRLGETGGRPDRRALEATLRQRFRCAGNGDATHILFQATLEYLLERAS